MNHSLHLRSLQRSLSGYLFLLPALLIFALFVWYPLVLGLVMSFQSVDMINPAVWVGWSNYQRVVTDPLFGSAWRNTLAFTGYALLFGYVVPLVLALLINEMRHGRALFRLAFYLPVMLPPVVSSFLWLWLYNADSGLINSLLHVLHLPPGLWLENRATVLPALVAGRASGTLRPGRHLVFPKDTPMANLFLSMLDRMDVDSESVGDSNGKLEHLSDL